jgi:drug/metabolite transporter (DMT)-like permease
LQVRAAPTVRVSLGIAAGVLSGLAFAVLIVGVRKTVTGSTSPEAVVFLINFMGVAFLGTWCVLRLGVEALLRTPPRHLGIMLAAGAMNLIGFLLITKGLQLVPVVRVNVVNNALTMALTVIAGIAIFREPWNRDLGCGIVLSLVGMLLINLAGPAKTGATAAR